MKRSSPLQSLFTTIFICALLLGAVARRPASASPPAQGRTDGVRYGCSEATSKLTFVGDLAEPSERRAQPPTKPPPLGRGSGYGSAPQRPAPSRGVPDM
jgi:hypothetical protein